MRAALALARWVPPSGRGERRQVALGPDGVDGDFILVDESYNANPTSTAAALSVLAAANRRGRRLAFLGDMLELGPQEEAFHKGLADLQEIDAIDRIHCCGPRMKALYGALPRDKRGVWAKDSADLADAVPRLVAAGDVCMVKGSLGARMARVVKALEALGDVRQPPGNEDD